MKKILYIHGWNGNPNGSSFNNLKNALPEGYLIESIEYNCNDCSIAVHEIGKYIADNDIDILIGNSLGGFITMMFGGMPRIAVNPCYSPSTELPLLNVNQNIIDTYSSWEKNCFGLTMSEIESRITLIGCFANNDELLGTRYVEPFKNNWGYKNNCVMINSGHHISKEGAIDVMNSLKILEENIKSL